MKEIRNDHCTEDNIFLYRLMLFSKALWKAVEKDWENWLSPFNLTINEHHILWLAYISRGATITEISKLGVMHQSTVFSSSKRLKGLGYLEFRKGTDKRITYIHITTEGERILFKTVENFNPLEKEIYSGVIPFKNTFGKNPEIIEIQSIIKHIYGKEFLDFINQTSKININ